MPVNIRVKRVQKMYSCYGPLGLTEFLSFGVLQKAMGDSHPFLLLTYS